MHICICTYIIYALVAKTSTQPTSPDIIAVFLAAVQFELCEEVL